MERIYLDNNSTTMIDPDVADVVHECALSGPGNPSSQHQDGQLARRKLEWVRSEMLGLLGGNRSGMEMDQLLFTSGGTESNNLALTGLSLEPDGCAPSNARILISSIEHPSIGGTAAFLAGRGFEVEEIRVTPDGVVDIDDLLAKLARPARLVSVMLVNNETGVLQPVREIAEICRSREVRFHTDAVQAVGRIPVDFTSLGVDALSFSAHKFHGPRGVGGLVLRHGIRIHPTLFGGFQQSGFRPGTEDICLPFGMLKALQQFVVTADERMNRIRSLRDQMQNSLVQAFDGLVVIGESASRVPHTLNFSIPGIDRQEFLIALDLAGISVSSGSACASGSSEPSPVLLAMGLDDGIVQGSIRVSLSAQTTKLAIDLATERIINVANSLRR